MNTNQLILKRAEIQCFIRQFFTDKNCLEVDTPLMRPWTVTDPYMRALVSQNPAGLEQGFLQTSPEYAMKKLLAESSVDIYQLGKVFRADEKGPHHAQEFTLLEWYRRDWNHWQLMDECERLLSALIPVDGSCFMSWQEACFKVLQKDISSLAVAELRELATNKLGELPKNLLKDDYLTLIFDQLVEPRFNTDMLTFIYGFPATQASLARTACLPMGNEKISAHAIELAGGQVVAERFEIYAGGLELANGFHELTDPEEQQKRFDKDNEIRQQLGYTPQIIDPQLMAALESGLPNCSGVAVGVDRLLMLACDEKNIRAVQF